jgi:mRNA interferase MazF
MAGAVKRGDIVTVSAPGAYGKPRPAVVIQSDALAAADSVLVTLFTSAIVVAPLYRLTIEPTPANGLKAVSQVMVDKIMAYPRVKCGQAIGRLSAPELLVLNNMLSVMIGLAD